MPQVVCARGRRQLKPTSSACVRSSIRTNEKQNRGVRRRARSGRREGAEEKGERRQTMRGARGGVQVVAVVKIYRFVVVVREVKRPRAEKCRRGDGRTRAQSTPEQRWG